MNLATIKYFYILTPIILLLVVGISLANSPNQTLTTELVPSFVDTTINPSTWRSLRLKMLTVDGDALKIEMLRSQRWIEKFKAHQGETIDLTLKELNIEGKATVLSVSPCAEIMKGSGRVVLTTVQRFSRSLKKLYFKGVEQPLEITATHRLYSESHKNWMAVANLNPGNQLRTKHGKLVIDRISSMPGTHQVYNIEVQTKHSFYVSSQSILSHNVDACPNLKSFEKLGGGRAKFDATRVSLNALREGSFVPLQSKINHGIVKGWAKVTNGQLIVAMDHIQISWHTRSSLQRLQKIVEGFEERAVRFAKESGFSRVEIDIADGLALQLRKKGLNQKWSDFLGQISPTYRVTPRTGGGFYRTYVVAAE